MSNYLEQLHKRAELMSEAYEVMSVYISIADELYNKKASKYSVVTKMEVKEDGIYYEYYKDSFDYSAGKDDFFVSREKIESLVIKYVRKQKLKQLKKLSK